SRDADLIDDRDGNGGILSAAVHVGAEIVHDDACPFGCARERVSAAHAAPSTDDDDHLAFERARHAASSERCACEERLERSVCIRHLDCGWPAARGPVYYQSAI